MPAFTTMTMAWIVGACAAAYLGCIVYAITAPARQPDPQRGMAIGCLMFAAIPGAVLAILLAIGVIGGFDGLIRVLYNVTLPPAAFVAILLILQPVFKRRSKR